MENLILAFLGLSAGFAVSCGVFAFISMIGIPPRLVGKTHTAGHINLYETMIILGGAVGNIGAIACSQRGLHCGRFFSAAWGGTALLAITGFFFGIFVGCMALALAEAVKAIPVFAHRISLRKGLPLVIASAAAGKLCGAFYQFFYK